jgi:hypothetical protein
MEEFKQNFLAVMQLLGIPLPTPAYLVGATLFGFVGLWACIRGNKLKRPVFKWLGVALMLYPAAVPTNTGAMLAIGALLCAALCVFRDR